MSETQLHGGVVFTDWPTASLRYELGASVDSWDRTRRTLSVGGELERLLLDDHVSVTARSHVWRPISSGAAFQSGSLEAAIRSSHERRGFVQTIDFGIDIASRDAPLALWSGAGEGHGRRPLLRAHPLLDDGVITGSTFGRRLTRLTADTTRWFERPALARIGVSGFVDLARATDGMSTATDPRTHADIGTGLRLALAGSDGVLRLDYARGMRDRRQAFSVGWIITTLR